MRPLLASALMYPSGTFSATQCAPWPPLPGPTISMIQASWGSPMQYDSPVLL